MAANQVGKWSPAFDLSNVAVHASLLPNGKVLYWGRRANPKVQADDSNLDEHSTRAFVWDPATKTNIPTANEPRDKQGNTVNIFCTGHAFLPDGTLLIAGGHVKDGRGINHACIYDPSDNKFYPKVPMNKGRWYPSVLTLPDGRALVVSGSYDESFTINNIPQIWPSASGRVDPPAWIEATDPVNQLGVGAGGVTPLYPRLHVSPQGRVVTVGPQPQTWFLDIKDPITGIDIQLPVAGTQGKTAGKWSDARIARAANFRDYAPSVMYDKGKIMYIGGGLSEAKATTEIVEFLDLNGPNPPQWTSSATTNMKFKRRQFNATILADGTVLVTGGTEGPGFNDFNGPVKTAELFVPGPTKQQDKWVNMAPERDSRLYHSTALLLPSGQVLSTGGGEYGAAAVKDCLTTAQLFDPPYLCKDDAPRPTIVKAPSEVVYDKTFTVTVGTTPGTTPGAAPNVPFKISRVTWVRLGSVTHCRNMNQSFLSLSFNQDGGANLTVSAPANGNLAPPGHYMLFVLDQRSVPSVAKIVRIASTLTPPPATPKPTPHATGGTPHTLGLSSHLSAEVASEQVEPPPTLQPTLAQHSERIQAEQGNRPPIVVGLTPVCPYGLGPCWGGAFDALRALNDVEVVDPVPSQSDSVAFVYPHSHDLIPDIDRWREELAKTLNSSYEMRGIEITLSGIVSKKGEEGVELVVKSGDGEGGEYENENENENEKRVGLGRYTIESQIRWDIETKKAKPVGEKQEGAYKRLCEVAGQGNRVQVTGTLHKKKSGGKDEYTVDVCEFEILG